jgi:hypothetical protein
MIKDLMNIIKIFVTRGVTENMAISDELYS